MKQLIALVACLLMVAGLTACESTVEAIDTAREVNDTTFAVALGRICGVTASLPAQRQLTKAEREHRDGLCELWRTRRINQ